MKVKAVNTKAVPEIVQSKPYKHTRGLHHIQSRVYISVHKLVLDLKRRQFSGFVDCMEMAGFLILMLISVGVFLGSSEAQNDLSKLPDDYQKGVELAVQQINSHGGIKSHFLFFKSLSKSDIEGGFGVNYIYHHFNLKATRCPKGTTDANPTKCAFRNDRPLIDCGICYKMYRGEIQNEPKPYVHCVHKPQLTQDLMSARVEHCKKMSYTNGSPTLLASRQ